MHNQRLVITILVCMIPLWGWAIAKQFSIDDEFLADLPPKKVTTTAHQAKPVALNPKLKPNQPNLNTGYLFNRDRFIKSTGESADAANSGGQTIKMETLQYDGSIIIGDTRKALISFEVIQPTTQPKRGSRKTTSRVKATGTKRETKIIKLDDTVAGYTITAIEPLQLTFTRGRDEIIKELFAGEKQRKATTRINKRSQPLTKVRKTTKKKSPPPRPAKTRQQVTPPLGSGHSTK